MNDVHTFPQLVGDRGIFSDGDWVESKDQDPNGDVRLVQLADIGIGEFIDKSRRYMTRSRAKKLKCTFLLPGDILIARMPDPIGRACIFPGDEKPCVTVVDVCIVRPDPELVDTNWLVHFINSDPFYRQIENRITGTTRKRVSRGNLSKVAISLPPLKEQKRIAAILDKADAIRRKRQRAIELAEQFLRSVFLDMFGDLVENPKGFEQKLLTDVALSESDVKCGPFGTQLNKSEFQSQGVPLWGIKHVNRHFGIVTDEFVSYEKADELEGYNLIEGDIVMTRKGTVGNASVYPAGFPKGIMHSDLLRVRLDLNKCLPEFLSYQFHISRDIQRQIEMVSSGAIMAGINVTKLKDILVIVPPLVLQENFEDVVGKIRATKGALYKACCVTEDLFAALSASAFRGELSSIKAA